MKRQPQAHTPAVHSVAEVGELLALGLVRLSTRKSSEFSRTDGESSLHFPPDQSAVCVRQENGERS